MLEIICSLFILFNIAVLFVCKYLYNKSEKKTEQILEIKNKLISVANEFASVRVRHGMAWEAFLPLMKVFEDKLGPRGNAVFLGQPIDLIYFNENEIVFVEVKTGNSRLSNRQKNVKRLIKENKIRWVEVNDALQPALQDTDQSVSAVTEIIQLNKQPEQNLPES